MKLRDRLTITLLSIAVGGILPSAVSAKRGHKHGRRHRHSKHYKQPKKSCSPPSELELLLQYFRSHPETSIHQFCVELLNEKPDCDCDTESTNPNSGKTFKMARATNFVDGDGTLVTVLNNEGQLPVQITLSFHDESGDTVYDQMTFRLNSGAERRISLNFPNFEAEIPTNVFVSGSVTFDDDDWFSRMNFRAFQSYTNDGGEAATWNMGEGYCNDEKCETTGNGGTGNSGNEPGPH